MPYEMIFRVPKEDEDAWCEDNDRYEARLAEGDDWPQERLEEDDRWFVNLCYAARGIFKKYFGKSLTYFMQVEWSPADGHHMHCVLDDPKLKANNYNYHLDQLSMKMKTEFKWKSANMLQKSVQRAANRHLKLRYCEFESYIKNYFYKKEVISPEEEQPNGDFERVRDCVLWAFTNLDDWKPSVRNIILRNQLKAPDPVTTVPGGPKPRQGANVEAFMETIDWLVKNGITTERQFCQANRTLYLSMLATNSGAGQIKRALEQAKHMMQSTMTAADYLTREERVETCSETNRIRVIMEKNGYDPLLAANIFNGWLNKEYGKRNTIWLYGPATTGKTIIAQAIAHGAVLFGGVNWTNENFPFCNCPGKLLIWWEEGKMTQKMVETAKCILGGAVVPVDIKGKMAELCETTPVIITSNTDMCQVFDGNSSSFEHTEPLQERMFMFRLNKKLEPDFGKVTLDEVKEFITWGRDNPVQVPYQFRVPSVATPPQKSINEVLGKRRAISDGAGEETRSTKLVLLNDSLTRYCNNITERVNTREIAQNNQCMLHRVFNCSECYPELLDDCDMEQ
nr:nonstructural protein [Bearded dragon parvovirus]